MHLVQLLLPLRDPKGQPFSRALLEQLRGELTERFGGVTAYSRAPAEGVWREPGGAVSYDDVTIVEVMCDHLDRDFWASYRERWQLRLKQDALVIRALPIESL